MATAASAITTRRWRGPWRRLAPTCWAGAGRTPPGRSAWTRSPSIWTRSGSGPRRRLASHVVPELASGYDIDPYAIRVAYLQMFRSLCDSPSPACVLLTDGRYGSAFFEHRYLSDLLGIPLVEGADLYVGHDGRVYARTLDGDHAGIWCTGGSRTWSCSSSRRRATTCRMARGRRYVLENLERLVIKARGGYGGIGVFVMPDLGPAYKTRVAHTASWRFRRCSSQRRRWTSPGTWS